MRNFIVLEGLLLAALVVGCRDGTRHGASPHEATTKAATAGQESLVAQNLPQVAANIQPDLKGAVALNLLFGPPVTPKCKLNPVPSYGKERSYFAIDLNGDASPEYFIEDWAGVHSAGFAVVKGDGGLLTTQSDVGGIGGDRVLILSTRHNGYYDILCSDVDPGGIEGEVWEFNGRRYVLGHKFKYKAADKPKAFIENKPGAVKAAWYADVFAWPRDANGNWRLLSSAAQ